MGNALLSSKLCDCDSPARIDAKLPPMPDDLDGRGIGVDVDYGNTQDPLAAKLVRIRQAARKRIFRRHWFTSSPPIPPPAAQQNRKRERATQGRIEPMDLLFSKIKHRR
jgi:hypothetical protein